MMNKVGFFATALIICSSGKLAQAQEFDCDTAHVSIKDHVLFVEPNGSDDTANLQCAINHASENNLSIVQLTNGQYFISRLDFIEFEGRFQGFSMDSTNVRVIDGSIQCSNADGKTKSPLRFERGRPEVRNLTLAIGQACATNRVSPPLMKFTGRPIPADGLDDFTDIVFGTVDRVRMQGTNENGAMSFIGTAIDASPEGNKGSPQTGFFNNNQLLGSITVNRSEIEGFANSWPAIYLSMNSSSRVDLSFNSFKNNQNSIEIKNANQYTRIWRNTIEESTPTALGAIEVITDERNQTAPDQNSVYISNNTFLLTEQVAIKLQPPVTFAVPPEQGRADIRAFITENIVDIQGTGGFLFSSDVSGGIVKANQFVGESSSIYLEARPPIQEETARGWIITENTGFDNTNGTNADILLCGATDTVIDPAQNAIVEECDLDTVFPIR